MKSIMDSKRAIAIHQVASVIENEINTIMSNHAEYLENGYWTIAHSVDVQSVLDRTDKEILAEAEIWIDEWLAHYGWKRIDNKRIVPILYR